MGPMPQNQKPAGSRQPSRRPQRFLDVKPVSKTPVRKGQPVFPAVGMTLSTYAQPNPGAGRRRAQSGPLRQPAPGAHVQRQAKPVKKKRVTRKRVIWAVVIVLLLVVAWPGFKLLYNLHRLFGNSVFSVLSTGRLKGESSGRINILLAGNSADDPGHQGGNLTDSIMVVSIDTKHRTGYMLSVPRDLYVDIGNDGHAKINTAYPTGESEDFNESGYAPGGMGLLEKTIQENLGITCQYYALVNYNALRDAVNSVGGIDFTVQSNDPRGLYDPSRDWSTGGPLVKLTNGKHHLNGEQALDLARARGDARRSYGFANSDFDRTENQRKLILALRSKATTAGVLANPVRLGNLFDALGSNVKTDLTLANVRRLYILTKDMQGSGIQSVGLNDADGKNLLTNYRTSRGESALVPAAGLDDFSDIQQYIQRLMSPSLVVRENAEVVVLNGTETTGLAARESNRLSDKNIRVDSIADADTESQKVTQIIDASGGKMPHTRKALHTAYPGSTVTTVNPYIDKYPHADFIVILGADRVASADKSASGD
jgi:polyisoprenyl-teichoic acid--peptidoglycan teichoic acid transferase